MNGLSHNVKLTIARRLSKSPMAIATIRMSLDEIREGKCLSLGEAEKILRLVSKGDSFRQALALVQQRRKYTQPSVLC